MMLRLLLTTTLALFGLAASAQTPPGAYLSGTHYFPIDPPVPTHSGDKIEVVEIFSFGCIHCANLDPRVETWKKTKPAHVAFSYLPAVFGRSDWEAFARAYYAGEALGISAKAHQAVFDGIWVSKNVRTLEDAAKVYAKYGKTQQQVLAAAKSFAVQVKLNRAKQTVPRYQADGTPTLIVAGKYRITGASAGGLDKMFDVVNFLVARELAAKRVAVPVKAAANG